MKTIYCADGNKKYAEIAIKYRFLYGAQLPNKVYFPPQFVDQDWEHPVRERYMNALETYRPMLATVLDLEREDQLNEVLSWAYEAAQYVTDAVIIIPKAQNIIDQIPRQLAGKEVRLGYSVVTGSKKFGGTSVPQWAFTGRPVHLLGGSPKRWLELSRYLDVKSADGNYTQNMAKKNQFFCGGSAHWAKNRWWPKLNESVYGYVEHDSNYLAFELSCINIMAAWRNSICTIRFATENDIPQIKKIANGYKNELGYVMYPSLRRGIISRELWIAEYDRKVVAFVNWHLRKDGIATIYEVAVRRDYQRTGIGRTLLDAIPHKLQLKCTVDNPANAFYERCGFKFIERQNGRKQKLNVWHKEENNHE